MRKIVGKKIYLFKTSISDVKETTLYTFFYKRNSSVVRMCQGTKMSYYADKTH